MLSTLTSWLTFGYYSPPTQPPVSVEEEDEEFAVGQAIAHLFEEEEECPAPFPENIAPLPDFNSLMWDGQVGEYLKHSLSRLQPISNNAPGIWTLTGSEVKIHSMSFEAGDRENAPLVKRLTSEQRHDVLHTLRTYDYASEVLIRTPKGEYYHLRTVKA